MKKAFRIIIPILLVIAVLGSIVWYFTEYDPELTRYILVSQARNLDEQGNHSLATWLYKLAYRQSGKDAAIALELAEQYRSMGNYTKAEYTLSNAIADGGSVELYIALCKTYVEQDKLLDAVRMLDNVADPNIKSQLDILRPAPPAPDHEPGYFNRYISVSLSAPEGVTYYTTDGSYPSVNGNVYRKPIDLPAGETTIQCISVSDQGLVSPLSVSGYTVAGVIEEITLQDSAIDSALRQLLNVGADHAFYSNELWTVTSFTVPAEAQMLTDLSKLPFLKELTIRDANVNSLNSLSGLTALETLTVSGVTLSDSDLQIIAGLPKLKSLTLNRCNLSGIAPLANATGLTKLDLTNNAIGDLTPLKPLQDLKDLSLGHNAVKDLTVISGLSLLEHLDLSYNSIETAAPLFTCKQLRSLDLCGNSLTTTEGITSLPALQELLLAFNQLTEANSLSANLELSVLDISNNAISDISQFNLLTKLTSLNFSYNQVTSLPKFSMDSVLVTIKGSDNDIASLNELAGLEHLNYVIMDRNSKIDSVNALAGCFALVEVSVYGTRVRDVSALKDRDIIVKFTPV